MKTFDKVPTSQFWEAIQHNAQMGQRHLSWVEYLDNIKVLCALIDERVETFQRRMRTEQLLREHRGVFQVSGADEAEAGGQQQAAGTANRAVSATGGDGCGL